MDITPVMVTGDAEAVARTVASELGIDRYFARVRPDEKARIIRDLHEEGRVAFVGDGINDAPALLEADLGVAIGAGTNVALESADLVLVDDDPLGVARALRLSRLTRSKMIQNLVWATGYNVVAIPLAAGCRHLGRNRHVACRWCDPDVGVHHRRGCQCHGHAAGIARVTPQHRAVRIAQ